MIRPWIVALTVTVIGVIVFAPSVGGGWIWDDHQLIETNVSIHSLHGWQHWFTTDFWNVSEQAARFTSRLLYWRPAVTASYAADWQLGGGSPVAFHVMNLVYEGGAIALAFAVLRRWIGGAIVPAAVAVLLFAVHPTKAESVAWIAGRTDILCMVGILVATQGIAVRLGGRRGLGIAIEACGTIIAYLCKEQAIVLPIFAFIETWVAAGRPALDRATLVRGLRSATPQLGLAIAYLVARQLWLPIEFAYAEPVSLSPLDHTLVVFDTFGRLFESSFLPHALSAQQGIIERDGGAMVHSIPHVIAGVVGLAALTAIAVRARRQWPAASIGVAFYLATIAPVTNLKFTAMITLMSERFLYLPSFGLAFVVGAALAAANREWLRRGVALAGACALALAMLSLGRAADFGDECTFWTHEARLHPESYEALLYQFADAGREKRFEDALAALLAVQKLQARVPVPGGSVRIATEVATIEALLVPDSSKPALRKLDRFCAGLVAHDAPIAELDLPGVKLTIPTTAPSYARTLRAYEARLLALRADLASRLGDDKAGVELAAAARGVCRTCDESVAAAVLASARAGAYADARTVLDDARGAVDEAALHDIAARLSRAEQSARDAQAQTGPPSIQARAKELATLGLWGRAYDTLAPYRGEIEHAPGMIEGFAELAFRAGEPQVAREVLAAGGRAGETEALFAAWAKKMGWRVPTSESGPSSP